ncbi:MAG: AAA family ATPase [Leptolyngbya sp. SIO4C1]|nr:AAA family ATPase [Leptolyngbya sp. SIO4C1]
MSFAASVRQFQTLVMSFHPIIVMETVEEERVQKLINKSTRDLQLPIFEWSIAQGLYRLEGNSHNRWQNEYAPPGASRPQQLEATAEPLDVLRQIQQISYRAIYWLKDFAVHLEDTVVNRLFREVAHQFSYNQSTLVITGERVSLSREVAHEAVYFDIPLPDRDELQDAIAQAVRSLRGRIKVKLTPEEMQSLVRTTQGMTLKQTKKAIAFAALEDGHLTANDIDRVLERKTQIIHETGLLDYIPLEKNTAQLGGFPRLKQWLARARVGFSEQARAFDLTPPKGILIVGIQGCGKSLAAKTIARQWQMPLLKLDAGRLYDKYVGESEKNFHQAVSLAEKMAPAVLWIDEIEKSIGNTQSDADGGLSRRLFGSFLTWLQEKSYEVFVVATANDLSQLPPELLRKGRFDEIFFVDLPDIEDRAAIFQIHLSRHRQDPVNFDLPTLVQITDGFSGAEIEQAIITSLYKAIYEQRSVSTELLIEEVKGTVPLSVSRREDIHHLRNLARERFVTVK